MIVYRSYGPTCCELLNSHYNFYQRSEVEEIHSMQKMSSCLEFGNKEVVRIQGLDSFICDPYTLCALGLRSPRDKWEPGLEKR